MTGSRAEREAAVRRILESNGLKTKPGRSYTVAPNASPEPTTEALEVYYWQTSGLAEKYQDPGARRLAEKLAERLTELLDKKED